MFIAGSCFILVRSSLGAQPVFTCLAKGRGRVSLLQSEEVLGWAISYKHLAPLERNRFNCSPPGSPKSLTLALGNGNRPFCLQGVDDAAGKKPEVKHAEHG